MSTDTELYRIDDGAANDGITLTPSDVDLAVLDVQILTAQKIGRSLKKFRDYALELATYDEQTAESCIYALPRNRKLPNGEWEKTYINGPSVRLAEMALIAWKHCRAQPYITDNDGKTITARCDVWDLYNNVAVCWEVKRNILNKNGKTFSEDMQIVTGQAALAIAYRNAVFKIIPRAYIMGIYESCQDIVRGDAKTLSSRRDIAVKALESLGATKPMMCKALGIAGIEDVTLDLLVTLKGIGNAIRDKRITLEEAFAEPKALEDRSGSANVERAAVDNAVRRAKAPVVIEESANDLEMSDPSLLVPASNALLNQLTAACKAKKQSENAVCAELYGKEPINLTTAECRAVIAYLGGLEV